MRWKPSWASFWPAASRAAWAGATVEGMDKPAVAASAEGVHPVVGLWPVAMAGDLEEALAGGLRRVSRWAEMQGAAEVFFPPSEIGGRPVDPFFNINRPEDFAAAEALLGDEPTRP